MRREKQIMEWKRGWKLILSSAVIRVGRSLLDVIALIPPRFCDGSDRGEKTMKLYHFPSPNPQKVTFALLELGLDCEQIPVDLAKGEV